MQDKKKNKATSGNQQKRQQKSGKQGTARYESRIANVKVEKTQATPASEKRVNAPIQVSNPRRHKYSRGQAYLVSIMLIAIGAVLFLILFTFTKADLAEDASNVVNIFGIVGATIANIILQIFGLASFFFPGVCLLLGIYTIGGKPLDLKPSFFVGLVMLIVGAAPILDIAFHGMHVLDHLAGGILGSSLSAFALGHLEVGWVVLIGLVMCLFGGLFVTDTSLSAFFGRGWRLVKRLFAKLGHGIASKFKRSRNDAGDGEQAGKKDSAKREDSLLFEDTPSQLLNDDKIGLESRVERSRKQDDRSLMAIEPEEDDQGEKEKKDEDSHAEEVPDDSSSELRDAVSAMDLDDVDDDGELVDISDQEILEVSEAVRKDAALDPSIALERELKGQNKKKAEKTEKTEMPESLNDIMSRILKGKDGHAPKGRSLRRHRSVPTLEPEYEFDSIVSPEQLHDSGEKAPDPAPAKTTGVLGNWKPKSIARKLNAPKEVVSEQRNTESSNQEKKNNPVVLERQPVLSETIALEPSADENLDDPDDLLSSDEEPSRPRKPENRRISSANLRRTPYDEEDMLAELAGFTSKTDMPALRSIRETPSHSKMVAAPSKGTMSMIPKRDDEDDKQRRSDRSYEPVRKFGEYEASFVVAQEKKKASEHELDEADQARRKNLTPAMAYQRPPLSLLHYDPSTQKGFDLEALRAYADKIERKLLEYHIEGKVVQICPGPIITRFEFEPAPGTKVAKISSLSDDLMMALEITSIRILAPIPGKKVVGIEIPNEKRNTIYLKEVLGSKEFTESKSILSIALGEDSEGTPVVSDLAKMPHLLVAGSTGSGKSVAINTMICSLLYNATPDEVKLILVDPKCLELSIYEGIPHLLVPPITTPNETASALEWACDEMDQRYRLLASFGVRNIAGYNEQVLHPTLPKAVERMAEKDENGDPRYKAMPYIVIVVDEFADLMMTSGKEIEKSIARLAQKARAAGIHLILATQRPSTNVITGVIKANFPTRLAFRVFSVVDSRTILDSKGAEALLGYGDSLFLPPNNSNGLQRVHGAFVSDDEVQAIVTFLADQRAPEYNLDITAPRDEEEDDGGASSNGNDDMKFDPLYDEAVQIVASSGQASASFLQRRLSIGFGRASRILDQMEREGVIGPLRGSKGREILIRPI